MAARPVVWAAGAECRQCRRNDKPAAKNRFLLPCSEAC